MGRLPCSRFTTVQQPNIHPSSSYRQACFSLPFPSLTIVCMCTRSPDIRLGHSYAPYTGQNDNVFILCNIRLRKGGGKKSSIKKRRTLFWRPHHTLSQSQMLYLSNLEKKIFRIAGALKLHFWGFGVLTINM